MSSSFVAYYSDVYLVKTDEGGNELWYQTFGESSKFDIAYSVQQTVDGCYIIGGVTYQNILDSADVYLVKTDANGNEIWQQTYGGTNTDFCHSVQQTSDGGYILAGYTESYGAGYSDVYLIRLGSEGSIVKGFGKNQPAVFTLNPPCPNPFNSTTAISYQLPVASFVELVVYDIQGCEIARLIDG